MSILDHNTQEAAELLQQLNAFSDTTENAADDIAKTLCSGGRLLACGNGGSAAEAAHLTTELVVRYKSDRPAYAALCLNVHGGDLTAIGNDYEFQQVF
ncbi:MAG: phosphoheptose isomerase, partial [Opitutaceae bacterium]|nr:phosphoheptose isomerase [Opitutaceae bacterium]